MKSLSGKTILITGAASGIGRHMALWFAKEKAGIAPAAQIFLPCPGRRITAQQSLQLRDTLTR